jgi:hypothetical protein
VTTENLAMLAVGQIIAACMFALGVLVGCSLKRKDAKDDYNQGTQEKDRWHRPAGIGIEGGAFSRGMGGSKPVGKTNPDKRAPVGRGAVWE